MPKVPGLPNQNRPIRPMEAKPSEENILMAAAQMHNLGRLIEPEERGAPRAQPSLRGRPQVQRVK